MGVDALIDEASALFRLAAGQLFTPGESTVWLTVNHGDVWLPEVPVVDVTDVRDRDDWALTYARSGQWLTGVCVAGGEQVQVTYSHGDGTVPDLVRLRVAGIVARTLLVPDAARAGVKTRSEMTVRGPFTDQASSTFSDETVGGLVTLTPSDVAVARMFGKRPPRRPIVMRP